MKTKPVFAVWIYWGAEMRMFVFSGLVRELARYGDVLLVGRKDVRARAGSSVPECCRVAVVPEMPPPRALSVVDSLANTMQAERVRRRYRGLAVRDDAAVNRKWSMLHRLRGAAGRAAARAGAIRALNGVLLAWAERSVRAQAALTEPLAVAGRPVVCLQGDYLSVWGHLFAAGAAAAGSVVYYPMNWRDISKGARVALPASDICVWNDNMGEALLRNNPWLRGIPLHVVGSTQFDSHFRSDWYQDRMSFCREMGLDANRRIMCYSAVNDNAYRGEAALVDLLAQRLAAARLADSIQILVRLNPTGSDPAYQRLPARHPGLVVLSSPAWDTEPASAGVPAWRANTEEDARRMTNLVRHCDLHACLPSTMVIDFGIRGVPSVCFGFDPHDGLRRPSPAAAFVAQEMFGEAFTSGAALVADAADTLVPAVRQGLSPDPRREAALRRFVRQSAGAADGTAHRVLARTLAGCADAAGWTR